MFKVYLTNFGFSLDKVFSDVADAISYGKSKGFEFAVQRISDNEVIASWNIFSGVKYYVDNPLTG